MVEARVDELLDSRPYVCHREVRSNQAYAAVDIEPDSARGDHALLVVEGRDAADWETVAPVNVRHGEGPSHDSRHRGDVRDLLRRLVLTQLGDHGLVDEDDPARAHARLVGLGDLVPECVNPMERSGPCIRHRPTTGRQLKVRVHINVRARALSDVNYMSDHVMPSHGLGRAPESPLDPASSSGGHARRGGRGTRAEPREEGEVTGVPAVPPAAGARRALFYSSLAPAAPEAARCAPSRATGSRARSRDDRVGDVRLSFPGLSPAK